MGELFKRTGRLFARPSFWEGASRVFDMGATLSEYNRNQNEREADAQAILSDWLAVGDSIQSATIDFSQEKND